MGNKFLDAIVLGAGFKIGWEIIVLIVKFIAGAMS